MPLLIIGSLLAILVYAPSFWVRRVMAKHSKEIAGLPGTGGELALHLIERFELTGIKVKETAANTDHCDPSGPTVRLSPLNLNGKSLAAIAVAAHEVGHAIQFYRREKVFELRTPLAMCVLIGISLLLQLVGAFAYLIILPEEWDASFNKALPVLVEGEYVDASQLPAIRQVLKAAALTYFAAALANVLHIGRWFMILRM